MLTVLIATVVAFACLVYVIAVLRLSSKVYVSLPWPAAVAINLAVFVAMAAFLAWVVMAFLLIVSP